MNCISVNSQPQDGKVLDWSRVQVLAMPDGVNSMIGELVDFNAVKSVRAFVKAGEAGYLDIECYGDAESVRQRLKGKDLGKAWIRDPGTDPQDAHRTYVVRCYLTHLSANATSPIRDGWGPLASETVPDEPERKTVPISADDRILAGEILARMLTTRSRIPQGWPGEEMGREDVAWVIASHRVQASGSPPKAEHQEEKP